MTRFGTPYFVSIDAATSYYRDQGDDGFAAVRRKLDAGEIYIGKPPIKDGEVICLIDDGRRYAIALKPYLWRGTLNGV
jgi:hypothetical protein